MISTVLLLLNNLLYLETDDVPMVSEKQKNLGNLWRKEQDPDPDLWTSGTDQYQTGSITMTFMIAFYFLKDYPETFQL